MLSFNYGARKYDRIRRGIRFATTAGFIAAAIPWMFIMLFPAVFIKIFNNDPALITSGVPAFRIYFAAFFFMTFQLSGQSVSQALGKAKMAIFFSLLRKAVIVAPLTVILPAPLGPRHQRRVSSRAGLQCRGRACLLYYNDICHLYSVWPAGKGAIAP